MCDNYTPTHAFLITSRILDSVRRMNLLFARELAENNTKEEEEEQQQQQQQQQIHSTLLGLATGERF